MTQETKTWPELAIGLYDKLTGKGATISYTFEDLKIHVPSAVGSTEQAEWKLDGSVKISTSESK